MPASLHLAPTEPARRTLALLPARIRLMRRPKWWQEILFIVVCYELYSLVRNAVPGQEPTALHRALQVLGVEQAMHIAIEKPVNLLVSHTGWIAYLCNYYYATLHFIVTIAVLVWVYRKHPLRYRSIRSVLFATNVVSLAGFWLFALAPPRMLRSQGFIDTIVRFHTWGSYDSADVANTSNQFAAMPSLHIGWALWCGIVVFTLARRQWVRILAVCYPLATLFVVLGTANHFVFDVLGGSVVLTLGFLVQRLLSGRPAFAAPTRATVHPSELAAAA